MTTAQMIERLDALLNKYDARLTECEWQELSHKLMGVKS